MNIFELCMLGIGLAMDAFAVSVCKGLSMKKLNVKHAIIIGLYFGGFQALMPLIGFLLGTTFQDKIVSIDHWIAFILLVLIGANMIKESLSNEEEEVDPSVGFKTMIVLAIATSIDALAVGVSLAFVQANIFYAITIIGVITFAISVLGVKIGHVFGTKYKAKAEFVGGVILILIGLKILLEGIGVL